MSEKLLRSNSDKSAKSLKSITENRRGSLDLRGIFEQEINSEETDSQFRRKKVEPTGRNRKDLL